MPLFSKKPKQPQQPAHLKFKDFLPPEVKAPTGGVAGEYYNFGVVTGDRDGPTGEQGAYAIADGRSGDVKRYPLPQDPKDPKAVFVPNGHGGIIKSMDAESKILDVPGYGLLHFRPQDVTDMKPEHERASPLAARPKVQVQSPVEVKPEFKPLVDDLYDPKLKPKKGMRIRAKQSPLDGPKDMSGVRLGVLGKIRGIDVVLVNGDKVRDPKGSVGDVDFTMGGNPGRYGYIQPMEVWVERAMKGEDRVATIIHEVAEYHRMKNRGETYDQAHERAAELETQFRSGLVEDECERTGPIDIATEFLDRHESESNSELDEYKNKANRKTNASIRVRARDLPAHDEVPWRGHNISLEALGGETRHADARYPQFVDPELMTGMGYFDGLPAEDGDSLDAIVGLDVDGLQEGPVFVIEQLGAQTGEHQQEKVMLGFSSEKDARAAFLSLWPEKMLGGIKTMTADAFEEKALPKLVVASVRVTAAGLVQLGGLDKRLAFRVAHDILAVMHELKYGEMSKSDLADVAKMALYRFPPTKLGTMVQGPLLKTPEASRLFADVEVYLTDKFGSANPRALAWFSAQKGVVGVAVEELLHRTLKGKMRPKMSTLVEILQPLLAHELRHAADWAYKESTTPGKWKEENPTHSLQDPKREEKYINSPTELMSYAGNVADAVWNRWGPSYASLSGQDLIETMTSIYPEVMRNLRPENRKKFLERVVAELSKKQVKSASIRVCAGKPKHCVDKGENFTYSADYETSPIGRGSHDQIGRRGLRPREEMAMVRDNEQDRHQSICLQASENQRKGNNGLPTSFYHAGQTGSENRPQEPGLSRQQTPELAPRRPVAERQKLQETGESIRVAWNSETRAKVDGVDKRAWQGTLSRDVCVRGECGDGVQSGSGDSLRRRFHPFQRVANKPKHCNHCGKDCPPGEFFGAEGRWLHRPCTKHGPVEHKEEKVATTQRPTTARHLHYPWHDEGGIHLEGDEHPHTSVPEPPVKNEQAVQRGQEAGDVYRDIAKDYGDLEKGRKTNLKFYDYRPHEQKIDDLIKHHGYQTYYAGGKYGKPDLANKNYNTGHLMVYDPTPGAGAFDADEAYTRSWRKIHELSHGLSYGDLNAKYGEGRRIGKLGVHRSLREAKRAVEWEWATVHKQRELSEQIGHPIDEKTFAKEINSVMHDAVHRAITGKFTNPDEEGFEPSDKVVPLEVSLKKLEAAAKKLGLKGEEDTLKSKSASIRLRAEPKERSREESRSGRGVDLEHYSTQSGLSEIDPAHIGTGSLSRREMNDTAVPVSFYYMKGTEPESMVVSRAKSLYETSLPSNKKLYDLGKDPEGLIGRSRPHGSFDRAALYQAMKDAGYYGFFNSESALPNAVALFYAQPAKEVRKLRASSLRIVASPFDEWQPQPKWMKARDVEKMLQEKDKDSDKEDPGVKDTDEDFDWTTGEEGATVPDPVLEPGTPWHLRNTPEGLRDVWRNKPVKPGAPLPPEPKVETSGDKNRKRIEDKVLRTLSPAQREKIERQKRMPSPDKPADRYIPPRKVPDRSSKKLDEFQVKPNGGLANILNVLSHARPEEIDYWKEWYVHAREDAKALADKYDVPENIAAALIAVLSPNTKWEENVFAAEQMLRGQGQKVIDYRNQLDPEAANDLALKVYPGLYHGKKETLGSGSYLANILKAQRILDAYQRKGEGEGASKDKKDFDLDVSQPKRLEWGPGGEHTVEQARAEFDKLQARGWRPQRAKVVVDKSGDPKLSWSRGESVNQFPRADGRVIMLPPFFDAKPAPKSGKNKGKERSPPKVTAFYNSIMHPEKHQDTVVLDGHAINIWRGKPANLSELKKNSPNDTVREKMISDYKEAAKKATSVLKTRAKELKALAKKSSPEEKERLLEEAKKLEAVKKLTPQQIQAITWTVWRDAVKNSGRSTGDEDEGDEEVDSMEKVSSLHSVRVGYALGDDHVGALDLGDLPSVAHEVEVSLNVATKEVRTREMGRAVLGVQLVGFDHRQELVERQRPEVHQDSEDNLVGGEQSRLHTRSMRMGARGCQVNSIRVGKPIKTSPDKSKSTFTNEKADKAFRFDGPTYTEHGKKKRKTPGAVNDGSTGRQTGIQTDTGPGGGVGGGAGGGMGAVASIHVIARRGGFALRRSGFRTYEGSFNGKKVRVHAEELVERGSFPGNRRQKRSLTWKVLVDGAPAGECGSFREARALAYEACLQPTPKTASSCASSLRVVAFDRMAGPERVQVLKQKYPQFSVQIDELAAADPTEGQQKYLDWAVRMLVSDHTLEDIVESLTHFHGARTEMRRQKMDVDINKYKTPKDLGQAATTARPPQPDVVFEKNGWRIVDAKDFRTLCSIGQKAWCVARDKGFWDRYMGGGEGRMLMISGPSPTSPYLAFVKGDKVTELKDARNDDVDEDDPVHEVLVAVGLENAASGSRIDWNYVRDKLEAHFNREQLIGKTLFVWDEYQDGRVDHMYSYSGQADSWDEEVDHMVDWARGEWENLERYDDKEDELASDILKAWAEGGGVQHLQDVESWVQSGAGIKKALVWYSRFAGRGYEDKSVRYELGMLSKDELATLPEEPPAWMDIDVELQPRFMVRVLQELRYGESATFKEAITVVEAEVEDESDEEETREAPSREVHAGIISVIDTEGQEHTTYIEQVRPGDRVRFKRDYIGKAQGGNVEVEGGMMAEVQAVSPTAPSLVVFVRGVQRGDRGREMRVGRYSIEVPASELLLVVPAEDARVK